MPSQISSPPAAPVTLNAKRKRDDQSTTAPSANGVISKHNAAGNESSLGNIIRDICEALQKYDTTPSVLHAPFKDVADTTEPAAKKARLSIPNDMANTILQKAQLDAYQSLEDFVQDIENAVTQVHASIVPEQSDASASQWKYQPDSLDADRVAGQLKSFNKAVRMFFMQLHAQSGSSGTSKEEKDLPNGVKTEDNTSSNHGDDMSDSQGKAVLTLFGNAQGQHKQLFSSFQKPIPRHLLSDSDISFNGMPDALMPLRENGLLGNQIISTKLVPTEASEAIPTSKTDLRFSDLFRPPTSISALTPPKASSSTAHRSTSITWSSGNGSSEPTGKHGYTTEKLPSGQWLGYDGISTETQEASPEEKRRRRDRALSSGEATRAQPEQMKAALARAKEDALFRRVYSSFGPTTDNSASLIPEETRNDMWWASGVGGSYDSDSAIDPHLGDNAAEDGSTSIDVDPDSFKDVVENFEPLSSSELSQDNDGDPQKILLEISDLLESLLSHQRVRNSQLGTGSRLGVSPVSPQPSPAVPNEAEVSLYQKSRTKLAQLVSKLPPYVLAKVGGDELGDLILSRNILLESSNYQGTMDDDQATRLAAATALNTALGGRTPSTNRPGSSNHGRTNSAQVAPGTPSNPQRSGTNLGKPPLSNWQTPAQSYGNSAYTNSAVRPAYNQLNNYNRAPLNTYSAPRPLASQQAHGNSAGYQQSPNQPSYLQRAQNAQYSRYAPSPGLQRSSSGYQQGSYQPIVSRPPSNAYSNTPTPAPQAPMMTPQQARPPPQGSPLSQGSPYAPPTASMGVNGVNQASRPITPSGAPMNQAKQSPPVTAAPSQPMTTSSSNGTPAP